MKEFDEKYTGVIIVLEPGKDFEPSGKKKSIREFALQRLKIARAVAPKPKILFLDEATSALDNITQKKVCDAMDKLKCTRIVAAHRLSTIKQCDRVFLINDGRIAEDGSYEELLNKNGLFTELVKRQIVDRKQG